MSIFRNAAIFCFLAGVTCASVATTADEVNEMLRKLGGLATVRQLYGTPAYDSMLEGISSGDDEWIDVAVALHPFSDAGFTSELNESMMSALAQKPDRVLMFLSLKKKPGGFDVQTVCGDSAIEFPAAHYETVLRVLETVRSPAVSKKVAACASAARQALARGRAAEKQESE